MTYAFHPGPVPAGALRSALAVLGSLALLAAALYFSHDALAQQTMNGGVATYGTVGNSSVGATGYGATGSAINSSSSVGSGQWQYNNSGSGYAAGDYASGGTSGATGTQAGLHDPFGGPAGRGMGDAFGTLH
jgi:hypothetical protein